MRPFWQAVGNLIRDPQSPYPSLGLQPAKSEPRDGFARGVIPVVAWAGGGPSRLRLPGDLAVGQRLLQVGDARVGELEADEPKLLHFDQALEMHQSSVGDLGVAEVERLQIRQPLQIRQSRIGDLGAVEVERPQLG